MGILMAWGPYVFMTGFASYEELKESFEGQWAEHKIFGRRPAGQYLGPGKNSVTIRGTIYPEYTGASSMAQIVAMKGDVESGTVNDLVTGDGNIVGPFRCEKGARAETNHLDDGSAQKAVYDFDFVLHEDPDGPLWSLWP